VTKYRRLLEPAKREPLRTPATANADRARGGRRRRAQSAELARSHEADRTVLDRAYWLRHCHGFLVNTLLGEEVGVVDDVEADPQTGEATTLIVCRGWLGRHRMVVSVDDVETIYPGSQELILKTTPEDQGSGAQLNVRR
jgi:hypothetical protein